LTHARVTDDAMWAEQKLAARFELVDDLSLEDMPKPEWVIDGIIPTNALTVLIAPPKSLKSFLALDWAMHIAVGLDWHDHRVKKGESVYIYAEGVTGLQHRVKAWKYAHKAQGRYGVLFLPRRVIMNEPGEPEMLVDSILLETPEPRLVIVDTLARNMGGDENSTEQMSAFVRGCDYVREETGATIVVVHHTGHAAETRGRGSSVLPAAADTLMQLSRDADRIQLECKFQKDAPEFPTLTLRAIQVADSLVLHATGENEGGLSGNRLVCLSALHRAGGAASYISWRREAGFDDRNSSFAIARTWLLENQYVRAESEKRVVITDMGRAALRGTLSIQSIASPPARGAFSSPPRSAGQNSSNGLNGQKSAAQSPRHGVNAAEGPATNAAQGSSGERLL
jgi:hypothetical protein